MLYDQPGGRGTDLPVVVEPGGAEIGAWSITTRQRRELYLLMLEAYGSRDTLERLFYLRLGRRLGSVAPEGRNHEQLMLTVLQTAEDESWADDLVRAAVEDRPEHAELRSWARDNLPGTHETAPAQPYDSQPAAVFNLDELRAIAEEAVGGRAQMTLDSVEMRGRTATFFLSQQGTEQLTVLRVEGTPLTRGHDQDRFHTQVRQAREAALHPRVADLLVSGFTATSQPYVAQLIDKKVVAYDLPLPAADVIDIGTRLADVLSVAHNWGTTFGEIEPSGVLLAADGEPIVVLPHLPMFLRPGRPGLKPHEEVRRLCETLLAMLAAESRPEETGLEAKLRERLALAMRGELIAGALRDQLEILRRESALAQDAAQLFLRWPLNSGAGDRWVSIVQGDLFEQDADIVVGFSDTFDTATAGSLIISSASLQGQLVQRLFDGDVEALDAALNRALVGVPVESMENRDAKPHGKLLRYPIGTVAVLDHGGRRIFAVAFSRMGNNLTAGSNTAFLRASLDNLWRSMQPQSLDRMVAMPVIGAGLSRMELSREELLGLIVSSYQDQTRVMPVCRELRIVAHPSDPSATGLFRIARTP
ncbi:macro domain-containing protein [Micromonospora sp. NPDC047187]|uniref:macro domain-containing protein n=1 Tax=Micromonospora sp. NPDC047187 TaxID=3155262 RepID=UPI0033F8B38A